MRKTSFLNLLPQVCVWGGGGGPATQLQKGGRMIVLKNNKRPLSTDFLNKKLSLFFFFFFQNADFRGHERDPFFYKTLTFAEWKYCVSDPWSLPVGTSFLIKKICRKWTPFFPKMRTFRPKMYPFPKNRGHANFSKKDPFSAKFRTMMRTLFMLEWRDRGVWAHLPSRSFKKKKKKKGGWGYFRRPNA